MVYLLRYCYGQDSGNPEFVSSRKNYSFAMLSAMSQDLRQSTTSSNNNGHAPEQKSTVKSAKSAGSWPAKSAWTEIVPSKFSSPTKGKSATKLWQQWQEYLLYRKQPKLIPAVVIGSVTWGLPVVAAQKLVELSKLLSLKTRLHKKQPSCDQQLEHWLSEWQSWSGLADGVTELTWAAISLNLAQQLPRLAEVMSCSRWWSLVDQLVRTAQDAAGLQLQEQPWLAQALAGELALTLAQQLPELKQTAELAASGQRAIALGMEHLLDGEGLLHARNWSQFTALTACWTRVMLLTTTNKRLRCDHAEQQQFIFIVREIERSIDRSGRVATVANAGTALTPANRKLWLQLCEQIVPNWRRQLIKATAEQVAMTQSAAESTSDQPANESVTNISEPADEPNPADWPSNYSEWAQVAVLQNSWKKRANRVTVRFDQQQVNLELSCGQQPWLAGTWSQQLTLNQLPIAATADWREVCHLSDADVDYLELELQLEQGFKLQRQIVLPRKANWCFLADAVIGNTVGELQFEMRLPLAQAVHGQANDETTELLLRHADEQLTWALPLSLSEWKSASRHADFLATDQELILQQRVQGARLYAPLWFAWNQSKELQPVTWRHLSVAEQRVNLARDQAAGYRVQVGEQQWLVYRSLIRKANRTLLGHNLVSEFLIGRFKKGETQSVVEVE